MSKLARCLGKPWLSRPIVHFVLIGTALFVVDRRLFEENTAPAVVRQPIVISSADIAELRSTFVATTGGSPTASQLEALIDDVVVEEILYREALVLGLDHDRGVRHRLIQKMRFLELGGKGDDEQLYREAIDLGLDRDDLVVRRILVEKTRRLLGLPESGEAIGEGEIGAYFERHRERFTQDGRVAFSHVFVSSERHGEGAEAEARRLLREFTASSGKGAAFGDPFPLGQRIGASTRGQIASRFGASFAEQVMVLAPGSWSGPVRSAYGLHLLWIEARIPGRAASLSAVRNQVVLGLRNERRERRFEEGLGRLRALYEVKVEDPGKNGGQRS